MNEINPDKEAAIYWHNNYASLVLTLEDTEERLSKANTLSLERYEVGERLIKENDALRAYLAELLYHFEQDAILNTV
jgi:hypothetical protein